MTTIIENEFGIRIRPLGIRVIEGQEQGYKKNRVPRGGLLAYYQSTDDVFGTRDGLRGLEDGQKVGDSDTFEGTTTTILGVYIYLGRKKFRRRVYTLLGELEE